ncbi:alpha/beta-hydrolase [Plenodomus tracheiphilus IPT5]|uniref:Alpha/beta-hydrolase n=1 Tax=Plenodomus tracheiphilus IPT5 TaxID=1408161 RepID=A0A6A7BA61_9PLEO|nr:alpha/beta-hydrolase [Plenodomus tracheiphilus IPT5]
MSVHESQSPQVSLSHTFHHKTSSHSFSIVWTALGNPQNPPLIFIHGTPWSSLVWIPLAKALSRKFHVYLFDNPGFGQSPLENIIDATWTPKDEVTRLDANLARQSEVYAKLFKSWEPSWSGQLPHVIAHDHGGLMSLRANLLHGCQYASLCLIDVVAIGPFGQTLFKSIAKAPQYFLDLPDMAFEGILESYIRQAAFTKISQGTMDMLKEPWLRKGGKEGFVRQLCQANSRSTEEVEGRYGEVGNTMPVKIIWGKQDSWIGVESAWRLGDELGVKEVVEIERAGHLIMYDAPQELGAEIGVWLGPMGR